MSRPPSSQSFVRFAYSDFSLLCVCTIHCNAIHLIRNFIKSSELASSSHIRSMFQVVSPLPRWTLLIARRETRSWNGIKIHDTVNSQCVFPGAASWKIFIQLFSVLTDRRTQSRLRRWQPSGVLHRVVFYELIDVSEMLTAFIIRAMSAHHSAYPDNGGSKHLWNVGKLIRDYASVSRQTVIFTLASVTTLSLTKQALAKSIHICYKRWVTTCHDLYPNQVLCVYCGLLNRRTKEVAQWGASYFVLIPRYH
jgi:hypothetical protein